MITTTIIVDPYASEPYSLEKMEETGLGGAERCVVTIAERLDCQVLQYSRSSNSGRYMTVTEEFDPQTIIVLRDPEKALLWSEKFPNAKVILWLHDHHTPGTNKYTILRQYYNRLMNRSITIVVVSNYHAQQIRRAVGCDQSNELIKVIYNPVICPENMSIGDYDKNKLIYFSTPYKAKNIIEAFQWLHKRTPSLKLFVAMPQYADKPIESYKSIVNMGKLPHSKLLPEAKTSLCTFYPNFEFPETFGLVFAESHAVGTPVIAHDVGAAMEVINCKEQVLPVPWCIPLALKFRYSAPNASGSLTSFMSKHLLFKKYEELIMYWRDGHRPKVALRPEFAVDNVLDEWKKLIG